MIINLSPIRSGKPLKIQKQGGTLVINDEPFDFSPIPDGGILPQTAIESDMIVSDVERIDNEINITIIIPNGPNATHEQRFPQPIHATEDGEIKLP